MKPKNHFHLTLHLTISFFLITCTFTTSPFTDSNQIKDNFNQNSIDFENDTVSMDDLDIADGHNVYANHLYLKVWREKCYSREDLVSLHNQGLVF
jgi:hypothetical protein